MRFVQLDEKNEERMNAIRKFTLMDDTFMTQVFSGDKESTQELLRIILKRKDLTVARSATQLTIGNLFGRSVRLDIYATDDAGKQYDIEVQQEDKGAAPERARLNSAMFDSRLTTSGEKYSDLPETYIIFITANDVLGDGLPVYNIERTIRETGKLFHDRAHIVYVNGAYRGTDEVGALMQDFRCDDYRDIRNPKIRARVKYFKEETEGVAAMCKTMQVIVDREREDAEVAKGKRIALNLWKNGEHDLDKIAQTTELSLEQVREAITEAGQEKVYVYSVDGSPASKKALVEHTGGMMGIGAQSPINLGKKAVKIANAVLNGEDYEKETYEETFFINRDNVEMYGADGWQ